MRAQTNPRHPLVLRTEAALLSRKPDKYGMLRPRDEGCLDIRVAPKRVPRAVRIMNRVLRLLEKTSHKVVVTSERKPRTMAMIDGEEIPFSLWESSRRTEHVARFGATEWPRASFLRSLQAALRAPTRRVRWALDAPAE